MIYCICTFIQLSKKNKSLAGYLSDREVLDVLNDFSSFQCSVEELVSQLRPLQPRYYSIASSPKKVSVGIYSVALRGRSSTEMYTVCLAKQGPYLSKRTILFQLYPCTQDANVACVCAAVVRYNLQDTPRTGVCTTFIQDRFSVEERCPVFISRNPDFRLPLSGDVPAIMIGPGTGIAPFRAFIQERCEWGK